MRSNPPLPCTKIPKYPLTINGWHSGWLLFFFCCRLAFINQLKNAREQLVRKEALPCSCDSLPRHIYPVRAPSYNFFPSIWYKYLVLLMSFQMNWFRLFKYADIPCLWCIMKWNNISWPFINVLVFNDKTIIFFFFLMVTGTMAALSTNSSIQ